MADINLDMFMPLFELKWIEVQGLAESTLGDTIREAAKEYGVQVQADKEPDQNRFIRSDQYSFIREGVPSLAFKFGYEFGTPEDKIFHDWVRDRYHKPSDDLNQPVDKASAAKFNRIIVELAAEDRRRRDAPAVEGRFVFQAVCEVKGHGNPRGGTIRRFREGRYAYFGCRFDLSVLRVFGVGATPGYETAGGKAGGALQGAGQLASPDRNQKP